MEISQIFPLGSKSMDYISENRNYGNVTDIRATTAGNKRVDDYTDQPGKGQLPAVGNTNGSKGKTVNFDPKFQENVTTNGIATGYDLDSTNRSLPANYGSSTLKPLNPNNRNLVYNDPYTTYQSDRGRSDRSKYSVYKDGKATHVNRGVNSAPGLKKPDRSRPLPKINTLVKPHKPDPLEKHLRQPAGTSTYKNGITGTSTKSQDSRNWSQLQDDSRQPKQKPSGDRTADEAGLDLSHTQPHDLHRKEGKRGLEENSHVSEDLVKPPKTSRTIYFGPESTYKSKVQQDNEDHIRRQMGLGQNGKEKTMPKMQRKGTTFYRSRGDDANTTVTFKSDREKTNTLAPRRERTRAIVNRARSELISRAKSKDDVRMRRNRNFVAVPVDRSHSRNEKIDREIYKLEEQMNIYLQSHGINMNSSEFDVASRMTGVTMDTTNALSRASSPRKKKRNPYTDPKRTVPPWHRKEYVLNKREADMYQHVNKIYGNEKLRKLRENNFYKKVEALQREQWYRLWDDYERKLRERDNSRKKHLDQLKNVRDKYTDDRWERIAKFPVNRIPIHDEDNRHDYGLPVDINEDPEAYVPRVGQSQKPKETFDSEIKNKQNVKRWYPIFRGYRKVNDPLRRPKMEGVDVVVLEDDDQEYNIDGKPTKKKRVKVKSLVKDAEDALEGASDESDWEDVEDAEELNRRIRRSTKTPADLNRSYSIKKSPRDAKYQRSTVPNARYGAYGTRVDTRKGASYGPGKPNGGQKSMNVQKSTQNAYKPQGNNRFRPTVGDFRSGGKESSRKGKLDDLRIDTTHDPNEKTNMGENEGDDSNANLNKTDGKGKEDKENGQSKEEAQANGLQSESHDSVTTSVHSNAKDGDKDNESKNKSGQLSTKDGDKDNESKNKSGQLKSSMDNISLPQQNKDSGNDDAIGDKDGSGGKNNKSNGDDTNNQSKSDSKSKDDGKSSNQDPKDKNTTNKKYSKDQDTISKTSKLSQGNDNGVQQNGIDDSVSKDIDKTTKGGGGQLDTDKQNTKSKDSNSEPTLQEPSTETINKTADDKENQVPKKQVRIESPEKPSKGTTRPVSPGVGKNKGNYKAPKKFEIKKSDKPTTRPESPSLFQKGLYHEPNKFQVKKSDKELTKANDPDLGHGEYQEPKPFQVKKSEKDATKLEGPDLGHGEYTAPRPYEITKTERTIRRIKSPSGGDRNQDTHTNGVPETHKRRTTRTAMSPDLQSSTKYNTRRTVGHRVTDDAADKRPSKRDQRHTDGDIMNNSRTRQRGDDGDGKLGRKTKKETTETTTTTRRRKPGGRYDNENDDEGYYDSKPTRTKPRQARKSSPVRNKGKQKSSTVVSQDPNRPDIPTPDLDTDDDDDDIFERAKRKYGIVLDDSD